MKVDASLGDVLDRVTILQIKASRIQDPDKVVNVRRELQALQDAWAEAGQPAMEELGCWAALREVNEKLWDVEDALREHERRGDFGERFVELARSVYHLNDQRAAYKRQVNLGLGSDIVEEKSYASYSAS